MSRFETTPAANIQRSSFDRSSNLKTTFDVDNIVPIFVDEVLPGDTFNLKTHSFGRISTPITALMDNLYMDFFYFFVPTRLIWDNFQKFMGEQTNPGDSTAFIMPTATSPGAEGANTGYATNSLQDYMGLPTRISAIVHQNLPLRAYNKIWSEWFRDQNLQTPPTSNHGDGPDTPSNYTLQKRAKKHDYFTSATPWAFKPPVGGVNPSLQGLVVMSSSQNTGRLIRGNNSNPTDAIEALSHSNLVGDYVLRNATGQGLKYNPNATLISEITINQFRESMRLQEFYEKDARGGTRYIEMNLAHFGVVSADARQIRSQYLGGGSTLINIHPVPQTSVTAATPQGNLASFGTHQSSGIGFVNSFTEHGYIIGLVNVRADVHYQQSLNKMWSRSTRVDHYFPAFANLGEQAVLNKELVCLGGTGTSLGNDNFIFGYQERYSEYKFKQNQITGQMRSNAASTFDINHLALNYIGHPQLSGSWITSSTPFARISAVPSEPDILLDIHFELKCARPMPMYAIPGKNMSL